MTTPPEGRGGYRRPSQPAPVSGPGALSRRTDGGPADRQAVRVPTGGSYGEAQELRSIQQQAPTAQSPGGAVGALSAMGFSEAVGLAEPTQRPGTPVTDGAALGPGADTSILGVPPSQTDDMRQLVRYLPVFEAMASEPGSSAAARNLVRQLKAFQSQQ